VTITLYHAGLGIATEKHIWMHHTANSSSQITISSNASKAKALKPTIPQLGFRY